MSHRQFLSLLDGLPDKSRYKGALRGAPFGLPYEWAPEEYRDARIAKQLLAMCTPIGGDATVGKLDYAGLFSPVERWAIESKQKAAQEDRTGAKSAIRAGLYACVPDADGKGK